MSLRVEADFLNTTVITMHEVFSGTVLETFFTLPNWMKLWNLVIHEIFLKALSYRMSKTKELQRRNLSRQTPSPRQLGRN